MSNTPGLPESGSLPYQREETFLARYPRRLKLGVLALLVLLFVLPWFMPVGHDLFQTVNLPETHGSPESGHVPGDSPAPVAPKPAEGQKAGVGNRETILLNDADDRSAHSMVPAPDPGLAEESPAGILPRIGEDGRKPWLVYARPFNVSDKRPRIAIVMTNMGEDRLVSDAALRQMPADVTMAFDAQSPVVTAWLARARQDGHETLLDVPMEPFDFPQSDPGAGALLTSLPNSDNLHRLMNFLRKGTGYVGVTSLTGSRFTSDPDKMKPVLEALQRRGLLVLDARVAPHSVVLDLARQAHMPVSAATLRIDRDPSAAAIDLALRQLEQTANLSGRAVGIASPLPLTVDHLAKWIKSLPGRGIALAPLTAVIE